MRNSRKKWWEKKWYWVLCILLPLVLVPAITLFFFPETPLSMSIIEAIATSLAVFFVYLALFGRLGKKRINVRNVRKMRRTIYIFGGSVFGLMIWFSVVIPLALDFNIPAEIVILLLFILMLLCAFIIDTIMKRRDYRSFTERDSI